MFKSYNEFTGFNEGLRSSDAYYFPMDPIDFRPTSETFQFFKQGNKDVTIEDIVEVTERDGDQFLYQFLLKKELAGHFGLFGKRQFRDDGNQWDSGTSYYNVPFDIVGLKSWGSKYNEWYYIPKKEADKILEKARGFLQGKKYGL